MRFRSRCVIYAVAVHATIVAAAAHSATCTSRPAAADALHRLQSVMASGRFVAYHPTSLTLEDGRWSHVDEASLHDDLSVLRTRFDGLVTYGVANGADRVADVAAALHFRAVILGVWDTTGERELANAIAAAKRHPDIVVGLSIGNERVFAGAATFAELTVRIERARTFAPSLAITTTEPFHLFLEPAAATLIHASDFMLVNVHPVFEAWFRDAPDAHAAQFVTNVVDLLAPLACGPIFVKETGVPTAPVERGFTPERQRTFYAALRTGFPASATRAFAYFSAYDAPWRVHDATAVAGEHPEEAHWGLYDERRREKPAVVDIPALVPATAP